MTGVLRVPHHLQSRDYKSGERRTYLEQLTGARNIMETSPEPLGHDRVENGVEYGIEVVEHSRNHEEDVLGLLQWEGPLPVQGHHHEHQALAVERQPADEECHHHNN